jgi:hypothetical protein
MLQGSDSLPLPLFSSTASSFIYFFFSRQNEGRKEPLAHCHLWLSRLQFWVAQLSDVLMITSALLGTLDTSHVEPSTPHEDVILFDSALSSCATFASS